MKDSNTEHKTEKFRSKEELGRRLFDEAVEPDMNQKQRLLTSLVAAAKAEELWEEYS